jgi:hypothetical protein
MPRSPARFRLSIKDNQTRTLIKVELIEAPGICGERRDQIRVNGQEAERVKEATLTEVFERLRRWAVARTERGGRTRAAR